MGNRWSLLRACAPAALLAAATLTIVSLLPEQGPGGLLAAAAQTRTEGKAGARIVGRVGPGRDVFRFETFGNEGSWTDAARVAKGMMLSLIHI